MLPSWLLFCYCTVLDLIVVRLILKRHRERQTDRQTDKGKDRKEKDGRGRNERRKWEREIKEE